LTTAQLQQLLDSTRAADPNAAVAIADALLAASAAAGASDVHLLPQADGLQLSWRVDGVLQPLGRVRKELAANVITRLKVMARLLTYRTGVPQEGRIVAAEGAHEVRISTFPTLFGEKIVARNLARGDQPLARIDDLGLPADVSRGLRETLSQTSGALVIAGPAGSGKTTTAYACLREIAAASRGQRSIATLEDPVEVLLEGIAQSQVADAAGFDLLTGLRSLVRQDPEVIFIGEIRDAAAAAVALQAALTGQLVITTFHATDAAVALSRLGEMGIPPYAIRSGVRTVISQRLLRRLCSCAEPDDDGAAQLPGFESLGLPRTAARKPKGCDRCHETGYAGRLAVAELLNVDSSPASEAILGRKDAAAVRRAAADAGMTSLFMRAVALVGQGVTSVDEVIRVFGIINGVTDRGVD
jgi:type II secretory ATPase GspE/PulE/Tfp pilus assembly ATPase PilB-like protein